MVHKTHLNVVGKESHLLRGKGSTNPSYDERSFESMGLPLSFTSTGGKLGKEEANKPYSPGMLKDSMLDRTESILLKIFSLGLFIVLEAQGTGVNYMPKGLSTNSCCS